MNFSIRICYFLVQDLMILMSICTYHVTNNVFVFFLNWFHLLKLLQKFGNIEKFDLLFHRSGPLAGQPRGYAFVTYSQLEDAKRVKTALDGTKVGTKNIAIKWAYNNEKVKLRLLNLISSSSQ